MKYLLVVVLIAAVSADRRHQTHGDTVDFSKILVRVDEGLFGGGQSPDPVYPPLAPPPSAAQTFRLVPANESDNAVNTGFGGQSTGFEAPAAPVTTQVLKLRRVGEGGGHAGASSGYAAPAVPQTQTFTLRQVEQEVPSTSYGGQTGGFGGQTGGFSAPIPAPQVSSFTLRQVEGGATGGQSSYARSDHVVSSNAPQVRTLTLRRVNGGSTGGFQRSDNGGVPNNGGQGASMPFGSEYITQVFDLIEKQ